MLLLCACCGELQVSELPHACLFIVGLNPLLRERFPDDFHCSIDAGVMNATAGDVDHLMGACLIYETDQSQRGQV